MQSQMQLHFANNCSSFHATKTCLSSAFCIQIFENSVAYDGKLSFWYSKNVKWMQNRAKTWALAVNWKLHLICTLLAWKPLCFGELATKKQPKWTYVRQTAHKWSKVRPLRMEMHLQLQNLLMKKLYIWRKKRKENTTQSERSRSEMWKTK